MAGGPQLRAAGTIGGNVCNGITSADTASTLVALDAVLRVRGPKGERDVPISEWYQGVGRVALAPYELLVKIIIPRDNYAGYTGHYIKYAQRAAMDIATLGVSCLVKLTDDKKTVDDAALAFGVAGPVPMRAPSAEAAVRGLPVEEAIAAIGKAALDDVNVTRYAQYLRRMTDKTQFIVITHRRGTMEAADVLYGVTMQEDGVSKLLRLDLNNVSADLVN